MATINEQKTEQEVSVKDSFVQKNAKALIAGVAAIVVIIVGIFCYKTYVSAPREVKASTAVATPQAVLGDAIMAMNDSLYTVALNGDKAKKTVGFLQVINDYSGTEAANLANLYAGLCYAHMEKWQDAQKYLENYDSKDDAMVSPAAKAALGDVYANLKQTDKAITAYKKAAAMADDQCIDDANNAIAPVFLYKAALQLKSQNKNKEALEILESVKAKYPLSQIVSAGTIDVLAEELNQIVK